MAKANDEAAKAGIAAYTWTAEDYFTAKNLRGARKALRMLVAEVTRHADLDVFDRSFAALGKLAKLDAGKLANLRTKCQARAEARTAKAA